MPRLARRAGDLSVDERSALVIPPRPKKLLRFVKVRGNCGACARETKPNEHTGRRKHPCANTPSVDIRLSGYVSRGRRQHIAFSLPNDETVEPEDPTKIIVRFGTPMPSLSEPAEYAQNGPGAIHLRSGEDWRDFEKSTNVRNVPEWAPVRSRRACGSRRTAPARAAHRYLCGAWPVRRMAGQPWHLVVA